jgi:hypothetical protein
MFKSQFLSYRLWHFDDVFVSERIRTPKYYRNTACTVWFKLKCIEPINKDELKNLWLFNSPNSHPSNGGMRGLIYLTYRDTGLLKMTDINKNKPEEGSTRHTLLYGGLFD